jgi:hypothetical protein
MQLISCYLYISLPQPSVNTLKQLNPDEALNNLIRTKPSISPPPGVSQASIDRERKELLEQLTVVSKRVFRLILERQTSCTMQLQQIVAVQVRHFLGSPRVFSI